MKQEVDKDWSHLIELFLNLQIILEELLFEKFAVTTHDYQRGGCGQILGLSYKDKEEINVVYTQGKRSSPQTV